MKKKIISVLLVAVILGTLLSGCTFISVNASREANQTYASVTSDGITLNITQNEYLDYFNSNAQTVIQQMGYEIDEAVNYLLNKKIESKYLVIKSMLFLHGVTADDRNKVTVGNGNKNKPYELLTWAEYYEAIKGVNEQIQTTIDGFVKEYEQEKVTAKVNKASTVNVEKIEFTKESLDYLTNEYIVGATVDTSKLSINIYYDLANDATTQVITTIPVSDKMVKTAFDTTKAGKDLKFEVKFDEEITTQNDEGEDVVSYEEHIAEYKYTVLAPRATKNEVTDPNKDSVENRYSTKATLKEYTMLNDNLAYTGTNAAEKDAYRRLRDNLSSQNKTISYFYESAFESAVLSAFQWEFIKSQNTTAGPVDIEKQFNYLVSKNSAAYKLLSTDKERVTKFNTDVASSLSAVYTLPEIEKRNEYFYVQQILINFTDAQKAFIKANIGTEDNTNNLQVYEKVAKDVKTTQSNTKYDPEFDCDLHKNGMKDSTCAKEKDSDVCPADPFLKKDVKFSDILSDLEKALKSASTSDEKLAIFDEYKYMYNDDPGIMNNEVGYLIPPEGVDSSFYKSFVKLGRDLAIADSSIGNAFIDGKLAYAYTDYGIHILMISFKPFESQITKDSKLNLLGDTHAKTIANQLQSENKTEIYTAHVLDLVKNASSTSTINNKLVKKFIKTIGG